MDGSLCLSCRTFFQINHVGGTVTNDWRHFGNSEDLSRSISALLWEASLGCTVCKTIVTKFRHVKSALLATAQRTNETVKIQLRIQEYRNTNMQWREDIDRPFLHVSILQEEIVFRLWRVSECRRPSYPTNDDNQSTGSEGSLRRAERWLNNCIMNHDKCEVGGSLRDWAPTRLLDIGPAQNISPAAVKLILTHGLQKPLDYTTLSHCWGSLQPLKLLQDNLRTLMEGISVSALPKTFQDAIHATWSFGFRYLWIDSLCIIQNSREDWELESSLMSQVYGGCVLNLAATSSKDCTGGLFHDRPPSYIEPCHFSVQSPRDASRSYYQLSDPNVWLDAFESAKLNTRAWVMQERLLSPRTVGFAGAQLFWECRSECCSEEFPLGYPYDLFERRHRGLPQPGLQDRLKVHLLNNDADSRYRDNDTRRLNLAWHNLVMRYSKNQLTFENDKLPAMSGLASIFALQLDTSYLAGLWRATLLEDLLWTAENTKPVPNRPQEYRAPSWSWASVSCPVKYRPGWIHSPSVTVVEAASQPAVEASQFGRVTSACVRLRGTLVPGVAVVTGRGCRGSLHVRGPGDHAKIATCTPDEPLAPGGAQPELFSLPLGSFVDGKRALGGQWSVGLLLVADESRGRGCYKRWGISELAWLSDHLPDSQAPQHLYASDEHNDVIIF